MFGCHKLSDTCKVVIERKHDEIHFVHAFWNQEADVAAFRFNVDMFAPDEFAFQIFEAKINDLPARRISAAMPWKIAPIYLLTCN